MKPKISIIMPVYNVEEYIVKSLKSVISQNEFKEFEIIIVNNGTTDRSIEKIAEILAIHPNILLIEQENIGISEARNTGVRFARGEFISFIDSDDWIDSHMLSDMYKAAKQTNSDIAVCNFRRVYIRENSRQKEDRSGFPDCTVLPSQKVIDYYFEHKKVSGYVWNKIYRRELFTQYHVFYPKGKVYEDISTTFELIWHSNNIVFLDKSYYNYFQRGNSITGVLNEKIWDLIHNVYIIKSSLIQKGAYTEYHDKFHMLLINQLFRIQLELQKNKGDENGGILKRKLDKEIEQIRSAEILFSADIRMVSKIKFLFMKLDLDRLLYFLIRIKNYKKDGQSIGQPQQIRKTTIDLHKEGGK